MTSTPSPATPSKGHAQASRTFTVPDGSVVTLDGPGLDRGDDWNCLFVASIHGARHAFTVCPRGTAELVATRLGISDIQVEPYRDADLMLSYDRTGFTTDEQGEATVAWRGRWHELHTGRTGPRPASMDSFVRIFDALALTDTMDGLLIRPRSRRVSFEPFTVFRGLPGLGDLQIQQPQQAQAELPSWRGAPARGGELWRRPFAGGAEQGRARPESLVLATPTAVSELFPGPLDTPDGAAAAAFLADLDVSWTPA